MTPRRWGPWLLSPSSLAAAVAISAGLSAWAAEPGYLDASICASCHPREAEGYAKTSMARSFGVVRSGTAATQTPLGRFRHDATEQDFTVSRRDGKLYLRRSTTGYDGKPADVLEAGMDYWIGSGNHARSFASRGSAGKLVELPLTWYPARGGHWGMSPGYDRKLHAGFSRKINYGCLFCHAGYPDLPPGADAYEGGWKLPERLVEGIDCQRCHGPGQPHVDAARQRQSSERVRAAIVNPKKLDPQRGMEVCLQCHLETTTLRLPGFLVKYDRGVFSYRPGEPLENYILHFDRAPGSGEPARLEFVGETYRLRMSACFRQSGGALTCLTCHNPHDVPRGAAAVRYYAGICQTCHGGTLAQRVNAGKHPAAQDCVSCHMPKRRPSDAIQTLVTDHHIRARPDPEPAGAIVERNDSNTPAYRGEVRPYPSAFTQAPENELYLAVAQVKDGANLESGLARLDALLRRIQPARGEFYLDAADAWRQAGQMEKTVESARQGVERMRGNWRSWFTLGNALIGSGEAGRAAEAFQQALKLAPWEPTPAQSLGEAYGRQGKTTEAITALRTALAADPQFAEAHNNLGTALLRAGDVAGAERELREAVRLRPESSAMQVNLAAFLARRGAMAEAQGRFELALRMNPEFAEGHSAYGSALAARNEWAPARLHFETALKLNPKLAVTHHNLGVVLLELSDQEGALREFRASVDIDPDYFEARLKLGRMLLQRGQKTEAGAHLKKAAESPDPAVRSAAAELLTR